MARLTLGAQWVLGAWLLGAAAARAQPAVYDLDPEHTTVAFLVSHIGYAKVLGRFETVAGSFRFDEDMGVIDDVAITVETASVSTGHEARDGHLRGRDFLASDTHPQMRFVATSARRTAERGFEIDGELELRGTTRPLTLHATLNHSGPYPSATAPTSSVSPRAARCSAATSASATRSTTAGWATTSIS